MVTFHLLTIALWKQGKGGEAEGRGVRGKEVNAPSFNPHNWALMLQL
jgi:hypothetical protein